jgi:thymidine kinase
LEANAHHRQITPSTLVVLDLPFHIRFEHLFHVLRHVVVHHLAHLADHLAHRARAIGLAHHLDLICQGIHTVVFVPVARKAAYQLVVTGAPAVGALGIGGVGGHADEVAKLLVAVQTSELVDGHGSIVGGIVGALYAKRKVQVFKPYIDIRYHEAMVVTHMGVQHEAVPVKDVKDLRSKIERNTQVILVEEAQFFDESLCDLAVELADRGREIVLAGLDQDFRREPFGPMPRLLAVADEVVKLRAICMNCGAPASHTFRQIDGKPAHRDDPIILIGATESYEARCRNCYKLRKGRP